MWRGCKIIRWISIRRSFLRLIRIKKGLFSMLKMRRIVDSLSLITISITFNAEPNLTKCHSLITDSHTWVSPLMQ